MTDNTLELKAVTAQTLFKAVRVYDCAVERFALIDQDGEIVGLVGRDKPFYIDGSFSKALDVASKGLHSGATYQGYSCSRLGDYYVIDSPLEIVTEFSESPSVRAAQELANDAINLARSIRKEFA